MTWDWMYDTLGMIESNLRECSKVNDRYVNRKMELAMANVRDARRLIVECTTHEEERLKRKIGEEVQL